MITKTVGLENSRHAWMNKKEKQCTVDLMMSKEFIIKYRKMISIFIYYRLKKKKERTF